MKKAGLILLIVLLLVASVNAQECKYTGQIFDQSYCNENMELTPQIDDNQPCENNYECLINSCVEGICQEEKVVETLQESINWMNQLLSIFYTTHECIENSDCPAAKPVCDSTNFVCVGCEADSDCSQTYPKCDEGACVECTETSNCGEGETCIQGSCEEYLIEADCTLDEDCENNYGTTFWCNQGECIECLSDSECENEYEEGYECDLNTHECYSAEECSTSSDCSVDFPICSEGSCVECEITGDCDSGYICYNSNCVIESNGAGSGSGGNTGKKYYCGDTIIELYEICDGTDLNGNNCATRGFGSGTLSCKQDCSNFDTTSCMLTSGLPQACQPTCNSLCGGEDDGCSGTCVSKEAESCGKNLICKSGECVKKYECTGAKDCGSGYECIQHSCAKKKFNYLLLIPIVVVIGGVIGLLIYLKKRNVKKPIISV